MFTLIKKDLENYPATDIETLRIYYKIPKGSRTSTISAIAKEIAGSVSDRTGVSIKVGKMPGPQDLTNFINGLSSGLREMVVAELNRTGGAGSRSASGGTRSQDLLYQLRTIRNILTEDTDEYNAVTEMIQELRNAPRPPPAAIVPRSPVPVRTSTAAAGCSNPIDLVSQEEWTDDTPPEIKIHFLDETGVKVRTMCYTMESIVEILENPMKLVARWLPKVRGGAMDDDGHGGAPSNYQSYETLFPYNDLMVFNGEIIAGDYLAIPFAKGVRYGNRAGLTTIPSTMHGQVPGATAYLVTPETAQGGSHRQFAEHVYQEIFSRNSGENVSLASLEREPLSTLIRYSININRAQPGFTNDYNGDTLVWQPDPYVYNTLMAPYTEASETVQPVISFGESESSEDLEPDYPPASTPPPLRPALPVPLDISIDSDDIPRAPRLLRPQLPQPVIETPVARRLDFNDLETQDWSEEEDQDNLDL